MKLNQMATLGKDDNLLSSIKIFAPVCRVLKNGQIQVILPKLDSTGDFIRLYVQKAKEGLFIHDDGFTLNNSLCVEPVDFQIVDGILSAFRIIRSPENHLVTTTDHHNFDLGRANFELAITALGNAFPSK